MNLKDKIYEELIVYIKNQEQVVRQLDFLIDKHTYAEEYEECGDYMRMKHIQEMNIHRLKRISQGLPAFETNLNTEDE